MDNREIIIANKYLIEPKHKCEHEPYEYRKYEQHARAMAMGFDYPDWQ